MTADTLRSPRARFRRWLAPLALAGAVASVAPAGAAEVTACNRYGSELQLATVSSTVAILNTSYVLQGWTAIPQGECRRVLSTNDGLHWLGVAVDERPMGRGSLIRDHRDIRRHKRLAVSSQWFCVVWDRDFRLTGRSRSDMQSCPAGAKLMRFALRVDLNTYQYEHYESRGLYAPDVRTFTTHYPGDVTIAFGRDLYTTFSPLRDPLRGSELMARAQLLGDVEMVRRRRPDGSWYPGSAWMFAGTGIRVPLAIRNLRSPGRLDEERAALAERVDQAAAALPDTMRCGAPELKNDRELRETLAAFGLSYEETTSAGRDAPATATPAITMGTDGVLSIREDSEGPSRPPSSHIDTQRLQRVSVTEDAGDGCLKIELACDGGDPCGVRRDFTQPREQAYAPIHSTHVRLPDVPASRRIGTFLGRLVPSP